MFSDQWIRAGYTKGTQIELIPHLVHYSIWYDQTEKPVGISISFEYADDTHYEMRYESWRYFLVWKMNLPPGISEAQAAEQLQLLLKQEEGHRPNSSANWFESKIRSSGVSYQSIHFD